MTTESYHLVDVLSSDAKTLDGFEEAVSTMKYSAVPGFNKPVPIELIMLVPRQVSENWDQELEGLSARSVNDYRTLAELDEEEWHDPGWRFLYETQHAVHCTRYEFQTAGHETVSEYWLEASARYPELRFGVCGLVVDDTPEQISKQEIQNGKILVHELHSWSENPVQFKELARLWLGLELNNA